MLKHPISHRLSRIKISPTLAVSSRAEELKALGKPIINLSVGEPDFDTPAHVKAAAIKAINDGHTKYTAVDGIKPLKQAIVEKFARENQLTYSLNQILVSCGAKHSIYNVLVSILNEGDEVIIPAPYWVSYPDIALLTDAKPVIVETKASEQFKMTADQLRQAITNKTKLIILNSPSNPTGMAYSETELKALADVILLHPEIIILSDDIYEHNLWQKPFVNIVNACPKLIDQTIVINGVSKAYAMTGWRIGYAAGPETIIAAMKKAQSQSTSNPASVSQYAALAALTGDQSIISVMNKAYKERHDYLYQTIQNIKGWSCLPSDGTFYSFPSITGCLKVRPEIHDDLSFSNYLLEVAEVAVIPGSAFGTPGYIRLSYATSMEQIKLAMERISKAVDKL